jgi:DNA-binding beta-propeller fold protein YncE
VQFSILDLRKLDRINELYDPVRKQTFSFARHFRQGGVRMSKLLPIIFVISAVAAAAQQVPRSTDLPAHPFFIKNTWYIGGEGTWDYLTFDNDASRLYVAHGTVLQVVDIDSGSLVGQLGDMYEARQVALDDTGQYGYVTDGGQGKVVLFDRQTLKKISEIDTGANPRWIAFDPLTHLVFVIRANPPAEAPPATPTVRHRNTGLGEQTPPPAPAPKPNSQQQESNVQSFISVIDAQTQAEIGEIKVAGQLGYAVGDDNGELFIADTSHNWLLRIDTQAIANVMRPEKPEAVAPPPSDAQPETPEPEAKEAGKPKTPPFISLDWTGTRRGSSGSDGHLRIFALGPECNEPRALAIDEQHTRVFAACTNRTLEVLNAGTGDKVTTLPIGPGADAVGYDREHALLFTSNGAGEGSITIIRQDVTDSYAVIQTLPTRQRANTLAVNPQSGAVYLVTDYQGVDLSKPGGIGTLHEKPVEGSFQILQVGN